MGCLVSSRRQKFTAELWEVLHGLGNVVCAFGEGSGAKEGTVSEGLLQRPTFIKNITFCSQKYEFLYLMPLWWIVGLRAGP